MVYTLGVDIFDFWGSDSIRLLFDFWGSAPGPIWGPSAEILSDR